ncbi:hypothetical protein [Nocardiopsis metallicus]
MCTGHDLFVKVYSRGAHLEDERQAIELTRVAGDDGVPTPRVRGSLDKDVLYRSGPVAVSVWE